MIFDRRGEAHRESLMDFQGLQRSMAEIRPLQMKCFYRSLVYVIVVRLESQCHRYADNGKNAKLWAAFLYYTIHWTYRKVKATFLETLLRKT